MVRVYVSVCVFGGRRSSQKLELSKSAALGMAPPPKPGIVGAMCLQISPLRWGAGRCVQLLTLARQALSHRIIFPGCVYVCGHRSMCV